MRNITLIAILILFPFITSASATNTGYLENQAQAYFSSVQGCEDVVVGVSVVKTEKIRSGPTPPTQAFIFGVFNNICDIGSSFSFADVITLSDNEFDQKGLDSAFLNLTTNIGGFDVVLTLDWNGIGKKDRYKNKIHIKGDAIIVHDSDVIASRSSDTSGTFLINGINYAVGTETGGLSTISAHTIEIQK